MAYPCATREKFCWLPARESKRNPVVTPQLLPLAGVKRMETVQPAPPANLTVAQLGKVLTKPAPSPKSEGKPSAPVTSREPLPPKTGKEVDDEPPVLSQTANPTGDDAGDDDKAEGQEASGEGQPEGDEPAEVSQEPIADSQPQASVSDAVTARLNTELQPLIEELTKAGAKGALQILQKRIPKLVDQRDTERNGRLQAEQRVTELETAAEEARGQKAEDGSQKADASHPAITKLSKAIGEVDGFIRLFKANPNGVEIDDGNGGKTTLDSDEVAEHLDKLRDKRTELLTERKVTEQQVKQAFTQTIQHIRTKASGMYPWLAKPDAPEQARLKAIVKQIPGLSEMADHELVVARYLRGLAAEQAEAAKSGKPATAKAPPSREPTKVVTDTPGSKAAPADAKTSAQKSVKEAEAQFKKSGRKEDLQKWESAKQKLKRIG